MAQSQSRRGTGRSRRERAEVTQRIGVVRALLAQGTPVDAVIDWCTQEVLADPTRGIQAKAWKVTRQQARVYIDRAMESITHEDVAPKDRKRARNRAAATMIMQRLMAMGTPSALIGALKAVEVLCKIDGSYDPEGGGGSVFAPVTAEEAQAMIEHAHATMLLARQRGVLAAAPAASVVIDVESEERDEDEPEATDAPERAGDAN